MEVRTLGRTGIRVSVLGLGTVKLGRREGVKYPRPFELPSDAEAAELIRVAASSGMNFIDTAPAYGTSEARLGELLAGTRDRWVLSSKFGETFENGVSQFDFAPNAMRRSLERSLNRLRTDHLDLFFVHSDGVVEGALGDDLIASLQACRTRGQVRAIGVSSKTPAGARAALGWADVLMLTLNPAATEDLPVIRLAHEQGVGVVVKKALQSGHAGEPGGIGVRDCLRFALGTEGVGSVIVGSASPTNVQNNCRMADEILAERGSTR